MFEYLLCIWESRRLLGMLTQSCNKHLSENRSLDGRRMCRTLSTLSVISLACTIEASVEATVEAPVNKLTDETIVPLKSVTDNALSLPIKRADV